MAHVGVPAGADATNRRREIPSSESAAAGSEKIIQFILGPAVERAASCNMPSSRRAIAQKANRMPSWTWRFGNAEVKASGVLGVAMLPSGKNGSGTDAVHVER